MKNLKKILIALAVVALLVSSFALIVGADEYTGDIEKLYKKYAAVDSTASAESQSAALAEAYELLQAESFDPDATHTVVLVQDDPATEDVDETVSVTYTFAELVAMINAKSVEIGEKLNDAVVAATTADDRMTATLALLDHLSLCPIAEGTEGAAALIAKADAANVAAVAEQFNIAKAADSETAQKSIVEIGKHLAKYPLDKTANAELLGSIDAFACEIAVNLYNAWLEIPAEHVDAAGDNKCDYCAGAMDSATSAHYYARYNGIYAAKYYIANVGFLVKGAVPSSGLAANVQKAATDIINGCTLMDGEMTKKQIALDEQASFDDYDFGEPFFSKDCESDVLSFHNNENGCYSEIATDIYGNKYQNLHYGSTATHLYVEPQIGTKNAYQLGMVIEWDMLFDDKFVASEFVTRHPSYKMTTAFTIDVDKETGALVIHNTTSPNTSVDVTKVDFKGAIARNVWGHFTLTYDNETRLGKLYVNYEYICDIEYSDEDKYQFVGFRMGKSGTNQDHGYDNFTVMNGTSYRIWDKFEGWKDEDLFIYYVDKFLDESLDSLTRNSAYNKAKLLYATVKDIPKCAEKIEAYDNCDYDNTIKKPAMAENLLRLQDLVNDLLDFVELEFDSTKIEDINAKITKINEFVSKYGELINKGDTSEGGYQSLMMEVNTIKANIIKIENAKAFVDALSKFDRATTLASMEKYAAVAESIYILSAYNLPENVALIEGDSAVLAFEASINGELKPEDEEYLTLFEYYEEVAKKIAVRTLYENAKKIISCMNVITSMEGYEATTKFWSDNADYIADYVTIARNAVASGNYDATVAGVDEAIATLNTLDVFFYELLQQQHIAALENQLAKYLSTEVYIDKVGVCAVVEQYLAENDIAVYNTNMIPEVAAAVADEVAKLEELIIVYGVYKDELTYQEADYKAVLAQNTQYFINTVNHMTAVLGYSELKPLFDKATGYYYSIDVNSDEAAAAADKYIAYREQLEAWETNGAIFVGIVDGLYSAKALSGVEREDAIYKILAEAMTYADIVDVGVEDVKEAMDDYKAELAAYNAELNVVNSEINESAKITCAVRTRSISNIVLAIISKIFED